jgi:hypothetical protein
MSGLLDGSVVPHGLLTACRPQLSQSGVRRRVGLIHSFANQTNEPKETMASSMTVKPIHSLLVG